MPRSSKRRACRPWSWRMSSPATLPPGLSLAPTGAISGTVPANTTTGVYPFSAAVTDSTGAESVLPLEIQVQAPAAASGAVPHGTGPAGAGLSSARRGLPRPAVADACTGRRWRRSERSCWPLPRPGPRCRSHRAAFRRSRSRARSSGRTSPPSWDTCRSRRRRRPGRKTIARTSTPTTPAALAGNATISIATRHRPRRTCRAPSSRPTTSGRDLAAFPLRIQRLLR